MKNAYIVSILLMLLTALTGSAQIMNRLGVDEDIFEAYSSCRLLPLEPSNLTIADSLYRIGVERNDYKIKTLALNVAFPAQYSLEDYDAMDKSIAEIKAIQEEHPDINDIYFVALYSYCQYLLYAERDNLAIIEAKNMVKNATEVGDPYGLMLSYRALAFIYDTRKNYKLAADCYKKAEEYCKSTDALVEHPTIEVLLAQELIELKQYDEARMYLADVEKHLDVSEILRVQFYYISALLGQHSGDNELFWKYYELLEGNDYYYAILDEDSQNLLSVFYFMSKGQNFKALEYAKLIVDEKLGTYALGDVYASLGEYKLSNDYYIKYISIADSLNVEIQNEDIAMLDVEMNNYQIREFAGKMQLKARTIEIFSLLAIMTLIATFLSIILVRTKRYQKNLEAKTIELQKATETAIDALENAKQANQIKTKFLQNMSHEIRTPLNAVVGFSQLMALPDGFLSAEEKDTYNSYIMNNTQMLTMLIDDILSLSDMENGNYNISKSLRVVNETAQYALKSVEQRVPCGVELKFSSEVDDSFMAYTDERRIQQVLINFLTNACKHTEKGSIHLHFSNTEVPGKGCFSVTDTGTGVPIDKADAIFDRFVKLDSFKQGAGIGLNICKIIAEKLGGDVYLDKSYTDGARFVFTFSMEQS